MRLIKTLFFTLALTQVFGQSQKASITALEPNYIETITAKMSGTQYFQIYIDQDFYSGSEDLVIKVKTLDNSNAPVVYVSKDNRYPNSEETSDWVCSSFGRDTCTINHYYINVDDTFYIGVKANKGQRFSISANLKNELILEDGVEMQVDFDPLESKVFKFYIPDTASKDDQNQVKAVTINAAPFLPTAEDFLLSATTDNTPNSKARKGVPGWRKGQTLRLSDQEPQVWCTDCWVNILVDVNTAGKYSIMAKSNIGMMQLVQDKQIDDVAFFGENVCYKYYIEDKTKDVYVRVAQFSGMVSYSFNPRTPAAKFDDAPFGNIGAQNSVLVATARARRVNATQSGLYYICVYPHMTSTFSLMVSEQESNLPFKMIQDSYVETGELQGKNISVYLFKAPPLEYKEEDIALEFQLTTVSGTSPQMFAKFCDEKKDYKNCAMNITNDTVLATNSGFEQANLLGNDLSLIIDHDEGTCQNLYQGECFYTIVVIGQANETDITQYQISVSHSQQNYVILQEGHMITDYVNLGTYRYYSFTLLPDKKIKNVTFRLNTLHGDADLFVSRKHRTQKPNRMDYEKSSVQTNEVADIVYFDDKNLSTTFYIGVYSYQYSTYNLIAQVDRGHGLQQATNVPMLIEGVPVKGSLHNEDAFDNYKIEVKQVEGYEKSIKIQVQATEGQVKFYVNYGKKATKEDYIWTTDKNQLVINPKDKNFHREGTYFIYVEPVYSYWQTWVDNYYQYQITYSTYDTFLYLKAKSPYENKQSKKTMQYYRHFVTLFNQDLSLSLTAFSGSPQMYVSFSPDNKNPTQKNNEFNTKNQSAVVGSQGKALYFSGKQIFKSNPKCKNFGLTEQEPCAMYIGVYCESDCKYSIKLQYENAGPQQLIVSLPQHDIVKDGAFNYYYLNVRENKTKQTIYAVLNSLSGNADLYIKFQENPHKSTPDQWELPTEYNYALKSVEMLHQDIIKIQADNLKDCFNDFDYQDYGQERECAIIFGIYAPKEADVPTKQQSKQDIDEYHTRYNFVVYTDILQLMSLTPITGQVDQGEYQYFLFESTCDDCTILISLSTFSSGDPDLYINFGDQRLPTINDFDIESATFKSEMVNININNDYYKKNKLTSMKGPLIIGVYGTKKSTFTISVSQEAHPVSMLIDNYSQKSVQEPYEEMFFLWYNIYEEKDFKIQLQVKQGSADLYVNTFDDNDESQNMVDNLPKSKRNAKWVLENIEPTSALAQKELLVLNQERDYCQRCYYLIGVITHDKRTDYQIHVETLDANFNNSMLLKVGEVYQQQLNATQEKIMRFIIDQEETVQIVINSNTFSLETRMSFNDNFDNPIREGSGTHTFTLETDDNQFQTEKMYYLRFYANEDTEFSILIMQDRQVIQLQDGVPMKLKYTDMKDSSKFLSFSLPDGEYTIKIQVKTNTESFYPKLYIKFYEDLESQVNKIEFPPAGDMGFYVCRNWDYKLGIMNYEEYFSGITGGKSGLAMNLFDISGNRVSAPDAEAFVTISTSSVIKMVSSNNYVGKLAHSQNYMIYQVDEGTLSKEGFLMIEFSQCLGESEYYFTDSPKNINRRIEVPTVQQYDQFGRNFRFISLPMKKLYIVVKAKEYETLRSENSNLGADFMIKVKHNLKAGSKDVEFILQNDGQISYTFDKSESKIKLDWNPVYLTNEMGMVNKPNTTYFLVASKNPRARLNSQCAIRKEVANEYIVANFETQDTHYEFDNAAAGEKYYLNVIAQVRRYSDVDQDLIPYQSIEINVPAVSTLAKYAIYLYGLVGIAFIGVILYFRRQTKETEQRLEFEMADVRNIASVHSYEKQKAFAKQESEGKYMSLVGSNGVADTQL